MSDVLTPPSYDVSAYQRLDFFLQQFDLTSLRPFVVNELTNKVSDDGVLLDMRQTPEYKTRFPGMGLRAAGGYNPITEAQYLNMEDAYKNELQQAGIPGGVFDTRGYMAQLIGGDVSVSEMHQRLAGAFQVIQQADPLIRQAFGEMFGPQGDGALAAYVLDEKHTGSQLLQQVQAAEFGGTGSGFGIHVGADQAMDAAQAGVDQSQARAGFQKLVQEGGLFKNTVSENDPLTMEQGVNAEFGLNGQDQLAVQKRLGQRAADFAGGGSAETGTLGATGLGAARSI